MYSGFSAKDLYDVFNILSIYSTLVIFLPGFWDFFVLFVLLLILSACFLWYQYDLILTQHVIVIVKLLSMLRMLIPAKFWTFYVVEIMMYGYLVWHDHYQLIDICATFCVRWHGGDMRPVPD